jgi:hypothetical protein
MALTLPSTASAAVDLQTLDLGGSYRLGPQQEAGKLFQVVLACTVEGGECSLGVSNVSRKLSAEIQRVGAELIRNVG